MFLAAALISAIVSPTARIATLDGAATIARDGRSIPAAVDAPFLPGDRLRTTAGGVEVIFPDGTTLDVDEGSAVDQESPTVLRLIRGRVHLIVSRDADPKAAGRYRIVTDRGSLMLEAGEETFARAGEAPVIAVEDQPPVVQVYGGAQVINERCSLVAGPSLAEIARRQPQRRASTRTIVMKGPIIRPPAERERPLAPTPTPSFVAAPAPVKMAPTHVTPASQPAPLQPAPSHLAPSHPAPSHPAPDRSHPGAPAGKMTSSHATHRP